MCQFGNSSKIIEELDLTEQEALIGFRNNHVIFDKKILKSINMNYEWPKLSPAIGNPLKENSEGIYNYNNYNYNHNNYNNYNYNYYNYYDYNYNYYNYIYLPSFLLMDSQLQDLV